MPPSNAIQPRGPAASHLPSLHPSNPYNFPPSLQHAARIPIRVTSTHIFFFGYEDIEPNPPSPYTCFSQWFPCPFSAPPGNSSEHGPENELLSFPTAEHYMMHAKALVMKDSETAQKVMDSTHPSEAKKLGREVRNFDREIWGREADRVVEQGNWYKFNAAEVLKEVLLGTGARELVEASPDDRIWGIGFDSDTAEGREEEWGENRLGKALMRVRERLRRED